MRPRVELCFTWAWKSRPECQEIVALAFFPEPQATRMLFEHAGIDSETTHDYQQGWQSTFAKLERILA